MKKQNTVFYKCPICGNLIGLMKGNINHILCCGREMELLVANSQDGAIKKHIPVYEKVENELVVKVGEINHPMEEDHYIMWIAQVGKNRTTRIRLEPGQEPIVKFKYIPNSTIYEYCNRHGLWAKEVE